MEVICNNNCKDLNVIQIKQREKYLSRQLIGTSQLDEKFAANESRIVCTFSRMWHISQSILMKVGNLHGGRYMK